MLDMTTNLQHLKNIKARVYLFVILTSMIGLILNCYPAFLFNDLTMIFGPAMSILVALSLGPWWGALAAAIVSTSLVFSWDNYYGYLLFIPEAFVVGHLYRKGWNELLAVAVYWIAMAIPVVLVIVFVRQQPDLAIDLSGKYLVNSFIYTLIASTILWLFSIPNRLKIKAARNYSLRTQIFTLLMVTMTIPIVAYSIYKVHHEQILLVEEIKEKLQNNANRAARQIERLLKRNQMIIQHQAQILSLSETSELSSSSKLVEFHRQYPQFTSLLLAAPSGQINAFSRADLTPLEITSTQQQNISDREYFQVASNKQLFISQVFKGRLKGESIIMLSAPVISAKTGKVLAIFGGSLNLNKLEHRIVGNRLSTRDKNQQLMVLDKESKVVFFSSKINVESLQTIQWHQTPVKNNAHFFDNHLFDGSVISAGASASNGWQIYTLYPASEFNFLLQKKYRQLVQIFMLVILFSALVAAFISYQINLPIQWLFKRIVNFNVTKNDQESTQISSFVPKEIRTLIRAHESAEKRLRYAFFTERKQQEKRINAEKASEAKSNFLSAMSHELRTPLNAISGFSQLLDMEESLDKESKFLVSEISIASQHLMLLINDVLDMSKIESGKLILNKETIDLAKLLEETLPLLEGQAKARNVVVKLENIEHKFIIQNDSLRLKQVLINLLSNAIKYNRTGGQVIISLLKTSASCCSIRISDTGVGIATERLSELFQKFNRLDKENSSIEGYGIGLLISKRLIELMKGKISVQSEVDKGSCFAINLPMNLVINDEVTTPIISRIKNIQDVQPCKILYVEDNDVNALVMSKAMQRFPQIEFAREADGKSGLARLSQEYFDFVLLDISLPDMTGYDILEAMQRQFKSQFEHVYAVSANAMSEDIDRGLAAGFDEYVTKPIKFVELFDQLKSYQKKSLETS